MSRLTLHALQLSEHLPTNILLKQAYYPCVVDQVHGHKASPPVTCSPSHPHTAHAGILLSKVVGQVHGHPSQPSTHHRMLVFALLISLFLVSPATNIMEPTRLALDPVFDQLMEKVLESFQSSLRTTVKRLTDRQNALEEASNTRLDNLREQLSSLVASLTNSSPVNPPPPQVSTSCYRARSSVLICNICKKSYESLDSYDNHVKEVHSSLQCCHCDKYLRSLPDLNYHIHKYHTPDLDTNPSVPTAASTPCWSEDESAGGIENQDQSYQSIPILEYSKTSLDCQILAPDPKSHQPVDPLPPGDPIYCHECGCLFTRQDDLERHKKDVHGDRDTTFEVHCHVCASPFKSMRSLNIHTVTIHGHQTDSSMFFCALCPTTFPSAPHLKHHLENEHGVFHTIPCDICAMIFLNKSYLSNHMKTEHMSNGCSHHTTSSRVLASAGGPDIPHLQADHEHHQLNELSDIRQYDGNDSVDSETMGDDATNSVHIISEVDNQSVSGPHDLRYNYTLNPQNQSNRLVTSALKAPLTITYNHFEIVDNIKYAFNVNVECNSGVYLTAIKPVLQTVTTDWSTKIGNWSVTCCKVSNRQDNAGDHLLCTVLTLNITDTDPGGLSLPHKVTLHFYHTKDKIQVQSSAILTPGTSAASWIVENLIEPLASNHIATNSKSIQQVNNAILSSISPQCWTCTHCNTDIDPGASHVRDQPLTCKKCLKKFHKRCSDRKGVKGSNWNKNPWFCASCLSSNTYTTNPSVSLSHSSQQIITVVPSSSSQPSSSPLMPSSTCIPPTTRGNPAHEEGFGTTNDIDLQIPTDTGVLSMEFSNNTNTVAAPNDQGPHSSTDQALRYPSNAIRQRKSNVAAGEPEKEFQKAVIDACRSTITQQEAELKRLNENLDIRNKKIMQLESQVGSAASYLSSRDTGHQSNISTNISDHLTALLTTMNLVLSKLTLCTDSPAASRSSPISIYNSPCQLPKVTLVNMGTQTDTATINTNTVDMSVTTITRETMPDDTEAVLSCTLCGKVLESMEQLDLHIESTHSSSSTTQEVPGITENTSCDHCGEKFSTLNLLQRHCSEKHATSYIKCGSCRQRFQNRDQLNIHMKATHAPATPVIPALGSIKTKVSCNSGSLRSSSVSSVQSSSSSCQKNL